MTTELAASDLTALCLTAASIGFIHTLLGRLERYSRAAAGSAILLCGVAIQCLGL